VNYYIRVNFIKRSTQSELPSNLLIKDLFLERDDRRMVMMCQGSFYFKRLINNPYPDGETKEALKGLLHPGGNVGIMEGWPALPVPRPGRDREALLTCYRCFHCNISVTEALVLKSGKSGPGQDPHSNLRPVTRPVHNFDPLSRNPSTKAVIVAGIPDSFIGGRNPFFSHFPVPPMKAVSGIGMTVCRGRDHGRLLM